MLPKVKKQIKHIIVLQAQHSPKFCFNGFNNFSFWSRISKMTSSQKHMYWDKKCVYVGSIFYSSSQWKQLCVLLDQRMPLAPLLLCQAIHWRSPVFSSSMQLFKFYWFLLRRSRGIDWNSFWVSQTMQVVQVSPFLTVINEHEHVI